MWRTFAKECKRCDKCRSEGLLDPEAFPILMNVQPRTTDILFVLEAPNRDDTYNPNKKNLTIDPKTDPSGRLFYELFVNELQFSVEDLFVTNSVLCLPAKHNGKYPVTSRQQSNCSSILRNTIDLFDPMIVCPLGTKALLATSRIIDHGHRKMADAVANPIEWYDRILFPLYHTSGQARNPRNGRPEDMQRKDWQSLRVVWKKLKALKHLDGVQANA